MWCDGLAAVDCGGALPDPVCSALNGRSSVMGLLLRRKSRKVVAVG